MDRAGILALSMKPPWRARGPVHKLDFPILSRVRGTLNWTRTDAEARMIKLTFCLVRLPALTREQFQRYWFQTHAPLVAKHREALRIRRYVQLHSFADAINAPIRASRGGPESYDGVAELWWESFEELQAATASPEGQAAGRELLEDERKFIDLARSPLFFGEEKAICG